MSSRQERAEEVGRAEAEEREENRDRQLSEIIMLLQSINATLDGIRTAIEAKP